MNTRQGILASFCDWRLWALVALAVFMADGSWAQASGGGQNGKFPFLSVDPGQARSIWGSFIVQWELFKSYTNNAVPALYYISLAATLVGAISIVFVKNLQDVKTISAWFLMVIICLFAPVNSKILFYPIDDPGASQNQVGNSAKIYGFTPQLVAIHIGSTLQVIFKDIFDSKAMKGLLDGALGKVALGELQEIDPGGPWVTKYNNYIAECGSSAGILPEKLLKSASSKSSASTSGTGNGKGESIPFSSALAEVRSYFEQTQARGSVIDLSQSPIPTIIIPREAPKGRENAYYAGVSKFYEQLTGSRLNIGTSDPASTVRQALDEIKSLQAKGNFGTSSILFYIAVEDGTSDLQRIRSKAIVECDRNVFLSCHNQETYKFFEGLKAENKKDGDMPDEIGHFLKSAEALQSFPTYIQDRLTSDKKQNSSGDNIRKSKCGPERGTALYEDLLNIPGYKDLDKLKTAIDNGTGLQDVDKKVWKVEDITSQSATSQVWDGIIGSDRQKRADRVSRILNVINSAAFWKDAQSVEDRQKILANLLIQSSLASSAKFSRDIQPTQDSSFTPSVTGGFLANTLGRIAVLGGEVVIWIASKFAGATAVAILYFVQVILDMLISLIILLTPVAFLFGIVIPSHAPGLLIQSVVILAIVKLVPVSFLIIDRMAGFLYSSIGILGGPDQALKENLFLFAMAGIYGGIVGMTMFLLFKIGDAQNIQKLTELDKAAEQAADVGMKVAQAAAVFAGMAAFRPLKAGLGYITKGGMGDKTPGSEDGSPIEQGPDLDGSLRKMAELDRKETQLDEDDARESIFSRAERDMRDYLGYSEDRKLTDNEHAALRGLSNSIANGDIQTPEDMRRFLDNELGLNQPRDLDVERNVKIAQAAHRDAMAAVEAKERQQQIDADDAKMLPFMKGAQAVFQKTAPGVDVAGNVAKQQIAQVAQMMANGTTEAEAENIIKNMRNGVMGAAVAGAGGQGIAGNVGPMNVKSLTTDKLDSDTTDATKTKTPSSGIQKVEVTNPEAFTTPREDAAQIADIEMASERDMRSEISASRTLLQEQLAQNMAREQAIIDASTQNNLKNYMKNLGQVMWGSFVTTFSDNGKMFSQIPVIGSALAENWNEGVQGTERWRVARDMGGWNAYRKSLKDGKTGDVLQQETGSVSKGLNYQQMMDYSGGSAKHLIRSAQQAAAEAAEKAVSQGKALQIVKPDTDGVFTARDYRDLTIDNQLKSIQTNTQKAMAMQNQTIKVVGGEVKLSPRVLNEMIASKVGKEVSGGIDPLFKDYFYLHEKDTRASYGSTTRTKGDAKALAKFIKEDIDTDYLVSARVDILQKKEGFMRQRDVARAFGGMYNREASMRAGRGLSKATADMPIQRMHMAAMAEGFSQTILRSFKSKFELPTIKTDMQDQVQSYANAAKQVAAFSSQVGLIANQFAQIGKDAGLASSELQKIPDAIRQLAVTRYDKQAFMSSNNQVKIQKMSEVFSAMGVDEGMLQRVVDQAIKRYGVS